MRLPRDHAPRIEATRQAWETAALATRMVDELRVEQAVAALFEVAGMRLPPIEWVSGPLRGATCVHELLKGPARPWVPPRDGVWPGLEPRILELRERLDAHYRAGLSRVGREKLERRLRSPLRATLDPLRRWLELEVTRRLDRPGDYEPELRLPAWPARWHHGQIVGGSFLAVAWVAGHDGARRLGLDYGPHTLVLDAFVELAGVGCWWPYQEKVVLCRRPTSLRLDGAGRPHAADDPAIAFGDDLRLWAWHGTMVPQRVVDGRVLDHVRILDEPNAELRRIMLERYGLARFRRTARSQKMHQDRWGTLWLVPMRRGEPIMTVEVVNATPEPDGTFCHYELRVPPNMRTALQAVAWTFGLSAREYAERMMAQT
jgi:hypothetical protein